MYVRGGGLGFWQAALAWAGEQVVDSVTSGGGTMSAADYYPAVKSGRLLCPGPFSIDAVAVALSRNPSLVSEVDRVLATDRAWSASMYGPLTTVRQKASALVNWAHGGRDCNVVSGERDKVALVERIMSYGSAATGAVDPVTGAPVVELGLEYDPRGMMGTPDWLPWAAVAALAIVALRK